MSIRLNFCRSVPPEFLRSFFKQEGTPLTFLAWETFLFNPLLNVCSILVKLCILAMFCKFQLVFFKANLFQGGECRGGGGDVRESDEKNRPDIQDHEDPQVWFSANPLQELKDLDKSIGRLQKWIRIFKLARHITGLQTLAQTLRCRWSSSSDHHHHHRRRHHHHHLNLSDQDPLIVIIINNTILIIAWAVCCQTWYLSQASQAALV